MSASAHPLAGSGDSSSPGLDLTSTSSPSKPEERSTLDVTSTAPGARHKQGPSEADLSRGIAHLGRYLLLHKIGQGGMGTVYAAYDPGLDRRVALKLLSRDYTSRAWLLREGQALGRLSHPHVVGIHEVGEHEELIFLAMEFVEGPTLGEWLADGHPAIEVIRMFVQAGRGLEAAHAAGLIHRDFKPDNVMIGKDGRVRVGDFGIAALADAPLPEPAPSKHPTPSPADDALHTPLTRTGAFVGTPAFMSPEQFRGDRATALSDQWSFCVALYQAMYHATPFAGGEFEALKRAVLHDPPATPPLLPEAPLWLGTILLRGLSRDPAQRFGTMTELLDAIEQHLPRDPNHDPLLVVRERELISKVFLGTSSFLSLPFLSEAGARFMLSPAVLLVAPLLTFFVQFGVVAARWRFFSRNRYGRQMGGLAPFGSLALLAHHLIALRLGLEGSQIITEDMVLFGVILGLAGVLFEPWLAVPGMFFVAAAGWGSVTPAAARWALGASGVLFISAMVVRLFLDRYMKPSVGGGPPSFGTHSSTPRSNGQPGI